MYIWYMIYVYMIYVYMYICISWILSNEEYFEHNHPHSMLNLPWNSSPMNWALLNWLFLLHGRAQDVASCVDDHSFCNWLLAITIPPCLDVYSQMATGIALLLCATSSNSVIRIWQDMLPHHDSPRLLFSRSSPLQLVAVHPIITTITHPPNHVANPFLCRRLCSCQMACQSCPCGLGPAPYIPIPHDVFHGLV